MKRIKSIRTKMILLIVLCVSLCTVTFGGAQLWQAKNNIKKNSAIIMNKYCLSKANELNSQIEKIEQAVKFLSDYAVGQIDNTEMLINDKDTYDRYIERLESVAQNAADNTDGACAVYVRLNPDYWEPTSGLFQIKNSQSGLFESEQPTDFSVYNPDDIEHVGWYYIPVKTGEATWLAPYYNENIDVYMISYVVPLYKNGILIGVAGMDINFNTITDFTKSIRIYNTGSGFLFDKNGKVIFHPTLEANYDVKSIVPNFEINGGNTGEKLYSYIYKGEKRELAYCKLSNDMYLGLSVADKELNIELENIVVMIYLLSFCILALVITLTYFIANRMVKPLMALNKAAKAVSDGNMDVSFEVDADDEIATLAVSFQETIKRLKQYMSYINELAYTDGMTGTRNKIAYDDAVNCINNKINENKNTVEFAVAVFDVNGLKYVNDHYGHDVGNKLITDTCKVITAAFPNSILYRIGGDEFVVIIEGGELKKQQERLEFFNDMVVEANSEYTNDYQLSIAMGISFFRPIADTEFLDVFKRADHAMYLNKSLIKNKPGFEWAKR